MWSVKDVPELDLAVGLREIEYRCSLVVSSILGCTKSSTVSSVRISSTRLWKVVAATINGKLDSELCLRKCVIHLYTF